MLNLLFISSKSTQMFTLQKKYFDNRDIYIVHNRISKKKLVPHLNFLRNIDHKPNKYLYTYMCQKLFTELEERKINNRRSGVLIFYINNNRLYLGYTGNSFKISRGLFIFIFPCPINVYKQWTCLLLLKPLKVHLTVTLRSVPV